MNNKIIELTNNYELLEKKYNSLKNEKIIPKDLEYVKRISKDLFKKNFYNNRACIFASYFDDDKIYIAYGESSFNLMGYDVIEDEEFTICTKLHKDFFDTCRYFFDKDKKRDLLITVSLDSHVKIIDFKRENSEIIIDLNFEPKDIIQKRPIINTAIFLNDIILVPFSSRTDGTIKFYNMNKEYISEFEINIGFILGLNVYTDEKTKNNYILIANLLQVLSYNMETSSIKQFKPNLTINEKEDLSFGEPYVIKNKNNTLLVAPCFRYPYIFIWDFIKKDLIKKIAINSGISDICFWDNKYVFAGLVNSKTEDFILINIKTGNIEKKFQEYKDKTCAGIKLIKHKDGNFMITSNMNGDLDFYEFSYE